MNLFHIILVLFILHFQRANSQHSCFSIDTANIISNKSLDRFIAKIQEDKFNITNNKHQIPGFIKDELDRYAYGFEIANPDERWHATDVIIGNYPRRKLMFLAKSSDLLVFQYKLGGIGTSLHLVLIEFRKGVITDIWKGAGGDDIKTIPDLIEYLQLKRKINRLTGRDPQGIKWPSDDYIFF